MPSLSEGDFGKIRDFVGKSKSVTHNRPTTIRYCWESNLFLSVTSKSNGTK